MINPYAMTITMGVFGLFGVVADVAIYRSIGTHFPPAEIGIPVLSSLLGSLVHIMFAAIMSGEDT